MFNWIRNLANGNKPNTVVDPHRQTRIVKRIVPASIRQAEAEAEAVEEEKNQAAAAIAPEPQAAPTITLTPNFKKSAAISAPVMDDNAPAPAPIRLSTKEVELPSEIFAPDAAPPMVRLTSSKKKPALNFGSAPAASASREIVLTVDDFVSRIPSNFLNEKAIPGTQEVRFAAEDLYSDMTKGRATVPLSIIAEVLPALFKRKLSPEEDVEIQLPLPKIVAQMSDLFTRSDQEAPEAFEELETPFLKAAQRDKEIHKVSGAVAAPQPEPSKVEPVAPRPKPPVLRMGAETAAPAPTAAPGKPPGSGERRVTVRVRPLIQAMPQQQRDALLGSIPEDSEVDLPLDQIESQLASGRVSVSLDTFSKALDPSLRELFRDNFKGDEVPISLPEVVKNLPGNALNLRKDQHEQEVDENEFETPFNKTPDTVAPKPAAQPAPPAAVPPPSSPLRAKPLITPAISNYTTRKLHSTAGKYPSPMHAALDTMDALDAKKVVKLASGFAGVAGLTIVTEDGLSLAGNLPAFMDPEGFSAMAPQLHRKMAAHATDMKLGELKHLSLSTDTQTVTIFTGTGMTIAVLHQNQADLGHGVRDKFVAIVDGLARQYNPATAGK